MEDYNTHLNERLAARSNFWHSSSSASVAYGRSSSGGDSSFGNHHQQSQIPSNTFLLEPGRSDQQCFSIDQGHASVKIEANTSHHAQILQYPLMTDSSHQTVHHHHQGGSGSNGDVEAMKAKIISHPKYFHLLEAFLDCQKVGATPEMASRLSTARQEFESRQLASVTSRDTSKDPELDQFMEAYYDILVKYRGELTRPIQEATDFMKRVEAQLDVLSNGTARIFSDGPCEGVASSEEDQENNDGKADRHEIDPRVGDRELRDHLLRKYSGYLGSLKQELSKKKKKGKLPKDARQKLLSWWELHYKWPYPSESEKVALADSTGLDQKQINNWFINQRKRHWKPSEDMQFMVMDGLHPPNATLYMDGHYRLGP